MAAFTQIVTSASIGGVPTVGVREVYTTGNVYYVDSNTGADTNSGLTASAPLATLSAALALATANKGDIILLLAGHAETVAASLSVGVEGVTILGLGNGDNRPQITFGTDTSADITVAADNVTIRNVIFKNDIDSQANVIDVTKAYCVIADCEFHEGSSKQFLIGVNLSHVDADKCKVLNCKFVSTAAGAASAIKIGAALDQLEVAECHVIGDYSDACIHNPTSNVATNLLIRDNYLENAQTGDHSIELVSACTGMLVRNVYKNDMTQATGCDPGSCFSFECYHCDAIDVSGILCPAAT